MSRVLFSAIVLVIFMEFADELVGTDIDTPEADDPVVELAPAPDPTYPSIWQSFGILLIFLLCTVVAVPILLVVGQVDPDIAMLLFYMTAGSLALAIVHSIRKRKLGESTYSFRFDSHKIVLPLIVASVALLFGVIGPLISLVPMPQEVGEGLAEVMAQPSPAMFLTLVVAAPILEELLFRGIMLDGMLKRYLPLKSILVSSIIFGLAHLNPWQFVTAFVMGCFAGWVYYRTRSVGPCILIHTTINFCAYSIQVLVSGVNPPGQSPEFEGGWGAILVFPALCLMIIFLSVRYLREEFNRLELAKVLDENATVV